MSFSELTLDKIRTGVLVMLTGLNFISACVIGCAIDSIPLTAWPVWIAFITNLVWLTLMAYANGWVYGSGPWKERMVMAKGYTCTDCMWKNTCMERSRNYCCTDFRVKDDRRRHGTGKEPGKQGEKVSAG